MQHAECDRRGWRQECAEDLAADGVVYAEVRMAPELCTEAGLSLDEVVGSDAGRVLGPGGAGGRGRRAARSWCGSWSPPCAPRRRSAEIAELALRHRDEGVVGFDIAGAEAGYPPSRHMDAFDLVRRAHFHTTIHAGEAFGLPSIAEALGWCGAERLGHGVRIVDDIEVTPRVARLGRLANYVRDRRVPLEMCPSSNVHTGAAAVASPSTPSGCSWTCASGSRSTPTTA